MDLRSARFNDYLAGSLGLLLLLAMAGCATSSDRAARKEASALRLFLEAAEDGSGRSVGVPVYRASPVVVNVERAPFLDEGNLTEARVVDVVGGFAIQVKFDLHGVLSLEGLSTANRGKRIAVFAQFTEGRWLAAPVISSRITDGVFTFTPDATREEADRIVRGLNNVAVVLKNKPKPPPSDAKKKAKS